MYSSHRFLLLLVASALMQLTLLSCTEQGGERLLQPTATPERADGFCPAVLAGITADPVPQRICLPPDPVAEGIMADVNQFWGSATQLCQCGPDSAGDCEFNAFSLFETGYIYYDPAVLNHFTDGGSLLPAYWILAHEFGHEIQGHFAFSEIELARELGADCYSGYFLGSLSCRGGVTEADLMQTLEGACEGGDGIGWLDLDSHGTCQQRVESVLAGIRAYLAGAPALESCFL